MDHRRTSRPVNGCTFNGPGDEIKPRNCESQNGELMKNGGYKGAHSDTNGVCSDGERNNLTTKCNALLHPSSPRRTSQEDYSCGLWSFRPKWLQPFANKKAFLAVFCLTSVLQGMYYTYFVSVLTTIEKLYQIQSKTTGIIMSATEIGQIGGALLLTYYGGQGNRPKWIACGTVVFAVASILCSMPHFLFSDREPFPFSSSSSLLFLNSSEGNATSDTLRDLSSKLCQSLNAADSRTLEWATNSSQQPSEGSPSFLHPRSLQEDEANASSLQTPHRQRQGSKCSSLNKSGPQSRTTHIVLAIFFVSLLFIGIGATAVYTLGIPYIDDNVATRESPIYFGITIGVRIFGPVFGFLLGSFCTSVYVKFPFENPGITPNDPQWIGAWWLGVFIVGAALILTSYPMMAFPRKLPQPELHAHQEALIHMNGSVTGDTSEKHQLAFHNCHGKKSAKKPSLKDFPAAMRRLLKNEILLCRTASSVLHILPIAGLYTFLPKYLESQFHLTATKANMISGMAGILVMGVGIFASGTFMRKFKPNARFVARWIAMAALAYAVGMVVLMWLGCPLNEYVGLNAGSAVHMESQKTCNETCGCRSGEFAPICTSQGVTYLSPCLAGCRAVGQRSSTHDQYVYRDCFCLGANVTATNGFCPLQCDNLVWYIIIFSFFVLVHSTSEVGSMLLTLRCVDPQDKAMALGLISFAIGLFGNVPCPIIYGAVVDSACLFWEDNCGETGACRVYDPSKFRIVFHGVTAVIMLAAFLVDAVVWFKANSIQFHESDEEGESEETVPINDILHCTQFESSV